jgi:hypothetical protein
MPRPDEALAAISVAGSIYFLVEGGAFPWAASRPPQDASGAVGPVISWHSHGSRVPFPPGPPYTAQWAHLPSRGVSLASPVALLELLAKAISVIRDDTHALTLPGGVRAVPAPRPMLPPGQL